MFPEQTDVQKPVAARGLMNGPDCKHSEPGTKVLG